MSALPQHEPDATRELQRLRGEIERLRRVVAVDRENRRDPWAPWRDPGGGRRPWPRPGHAEQRSRQGQDGPEPQQEAAELVRGIQAIADARQGRSESGNRVRL
jgi:hypothetical protein